ncbi:MAG: prolyl oligopeptidase family serine peptidase [Pseudomonadota bacterium]
MTTVTFRRAFLLAWLIPTLVAGSAAPSASACGARSDCNIGDRLYRIRMPAGHDGKTPVGALVFSHGYRGSVRGAVESEGLAAMAKRWGVAIIATKSKGDGWALPGTPSNLAETGAAELAYFDRVLDDAAKRFPIDLKRVVATGFSAGGMMVWTLACHRSHRFAGFIPLAGTFWQPEPKTCTSPPASVVHIHGTKDRVVPLKGRPIGQAHQGDVATVLGMYKSYGGFEPKGRQKIRNLDCQLSSNAAGHLLNYCAFPGGHTLSIRHIAIAWDMLKAAGKI